MNLLGVLICKVKGHKRGKRMVVFTLDGAVSDSESYERKYQCQRCGATWIRKISKAKAA